MAFWSRLNHALGFDRAKKDVRAAETEGRSRLWRATYFLRPLLALLVILYTVAAILRLSVLSGDAMDYAQPVLAPAAAPEQVAAPMGGDAQEQVAAAACHESEIADMTARIVEIIAQENVWVPADPQYKIGWFGVFGFAPGPFFDNKAAFQIGAMRVVRRVSVELADILGRIRGTSAPDDDLVAARGFLQTQERAWIFNPFDARLATFATSAASAYADAAERLHAYNDRVAACDATFDARADNLFQLLDRAANEIGGMVDQLSQRASTGRWSVEEKMMVDQGWGFGFFDFKADNLFHEARGMMWAWHGIMQAARADFADVIAQRNLDSVWDQMEIHIAQSAALNPLVVSNGAEDSLLAPAHLASMGVNMLRARANMTEIRGILDR